MNKGLRKRIYAYGISVCMLFGAAPIMAADTTTQQTGEDTSSPTKTPTLSPETWDAMDNSYLKTAEEMTIDISALPTTVNRTIKIPKEVTKVTIRGNTGKQYTGLIIEAEEGRSASLSLTIQDLKIINGNIDIATSTTGDFLYVVGNNEISAQSQKAAINVKEGKKLVIDAKDSSQTLTAIGGSGGGAGIGGSYLSNNGSGDIIIKNGIINATGKDGGAGIGQGNQPNGSPSTNITILGGIITADGGSTSASSGGAGIGGSLNGSINNISISGSATKVIAKAGAGSAGIGAGSKACGNIEIKDGAIIEAAIGNDGGAGIGGGNSSEAKVKDITITSATIIEATGSNGGAGIGGGNAAAPKNIFIGGTTVIGSTDSTGGPIKGAVGSNGGAGIGGGAIGDTIVSIKIEGQDIKRAIGDAGAAGIGGGKNCGVTKIELTGGTYGYILGGEGAAGIGTGTIGEVGTITLSGNTKINYVEGGGKISDATPYGGAGIGGGYQRGVELTITDNVVIEHAKGGYNTGALGGGAQGSAGTDIIKITSGKVYAEAGEGIVYNDIGGSLEREDKIDVNIGASGDVFIRNNVVRKIDETTKANRANYIFQCYDKDGNQMKNINFLIKSTTDPSYELKPITDANGNGYAWLKKINPATESFGKLGYYFKITDATTNKIYVAKQDGNPILNPEIDGITQITIKLKFSESAERKDIGTPAIVNGNGIVPYALSKVAYEVDLNNFTGNQTVLDLKSIIDLNFISTDPTKFDLSKNIAVMVKKDGVRNTTLENKLKGNNPSGVAYIQKNATDNKVNVTYPNEMLGAGKYEITFYISSQLNNSIKVKKYYDDEVSTSHKKQVKVLTSGNVKTKIFVDATNAIEDIYPISKLQDVDVPYNQLTKIN